MRRHWVTMGALDLLIIALVAMIAVGTGEGTEEGPALKIPTKCPAKDPMDSTVHLKHEVMCSLFYKCQAGEKIVMPCAKENEKTGDLEFFNPELQVCDWRRNVSCTNPRCPLNTDSSGRFIKIPYGFNCRDYYDCEDRRLVMRECPEEEKFDYNQRKCVRNANCEPIQNCDSIYKEPFEENCSFYSICQGTRKTVLPCPEGKYFSKKRQDCVDSEDSDCGGKEPGGVPCKGTGKAPHPSDCRLYKQCVNGFEEIKQCPRGLHYNAFSQECQDPAIAGCDSAMPCNPFFPFYIGTIRCNGDKKAPNKCDCSGYIQCVHGIKIPMKCPKGMHFNSYAQECQDPCDAGCDKSWPCETPTPTPTPTPRPPECTGNGKRPDKHNCNKYEQCVNGKIVSKSCPPGLHFNPYEQVCQDPCDAGCDKNWPCETPTPTPTPTPRPPECTGNGKRPDKHNCNKYEQCVNGKIVSKNCPPGLHFNPYEQECQDPCDAGCDKNWPCETPTPTPTPTPRPPECTGNGKRPDKHNCNKYEQCVNGKIVSKNCSPGLHFNPYEQECQDPCDAGCDKNWPCETPTPTPTPTPRPPECTGNGKRPDKHNCNKYEQCVNGKIVSKNCPPGLHFNPYEQECQDPCDAGCDKNWPCETPTPTPTPTPRPPECTGNGKRPDKHNCNKYEQCVNGKIVSKNCPPGLHFNPYEQECQDPCDAGCDKNWPCETPTPTPTPTPKPGECTGNGKIPDRCDCSKYKQCVNGRIVSKNCPPGLHFNPYEQECQSPCDAGCDKDWPCGPGRECNGEGGMKPDPDDCRLYTKCVDGRIRIIMCPYGKHFNPFAHVCQDPSIAGCDESTCESPTKPPPSECKGNGKSPDKCDCTSYRQCKDGNIITKKCPNGWHFNPFESECQPPCEARCDKNHPCPPPTPKPEPECSGDYKASHPYDCHVYKVCENGHIKEVRCPGEDHFNPYAQKCQHPCVARCDKTYPCPTKPTDPEPECSGDRKSPDPDNCRMYQVCIKGEIDRMLCPSDKYFNPYTGKCQRQSGSGCDERVCIPECIEGTKRPHVCDCRLYYECVNGADRVRDCGKGLHFNPITKQCEHPHDADCTLPYPSLYGECFGSEKVPHELNCGSYYECKDNIKVPRVCPDGQQFSTLAQTCVDPEDARADCEPLLS